MGKPPANFICSLEDLSDVITAVVNRAVEKGATSTTSGNYYMGYEAFSDLITEEDYLHYFDLIVYELQGREELLDLEVLYDSHELDCNFGLDYCPSYQFCEGDEEIFGSFEEWEQTPTKPVSQPLSMHRMALIGENAVQIFQKWAKTPIGKLFGFLGFGKKNSESIEFDLNSHERRKLLNQQKSDLMVKIIIDDGIISGVLSNGPVNVEIVDINRDYGDYEALRAYSHELYDDPKLKSIEYSVAHF